MLLHPRALASHFHSRTFGASECSIIYIEIGTDIYISIEHSIMFANDEH